MKIVWTFFAALLLFAASPLQAAEMKLCTGSKTGKYFATGKMLAAQARGDIAIEVLNSKGSLDNLKRIASGECDAAIVQSDAYGIYALENPANAIDLERVGALYPEYVHLICNSESGIKSVGDLEDNPKDYTILVGPNGSGTQITWKTWIKYDEDYGEVPTKPIGGNRALAKVVDGSEAQCMLFVVGLGSASMIKADTVGKGKTALVEINDWDFNDAEDPKGNRVYEFADIPGDTYDNWQAGWGGAVETLTLSAVLVVNTVWADENSDAFESFYDYYFAVLKELGGEG